MEAPAPTVSKPNGHPADGMTIHVEVGEGAKMEIIDPRSFANGGPEWQMRYGNPERIRYTVAGLLDSYDYLLSNHITGKEAARRLAIMRRHRRAAKDMWMDEIDSVGELFRTEEITREDAMKRLARLGFKPSEAGDMLDEVAS